MTPSYRGARELAALVAQASTTELEQLVRQLAGAALSDHAIAAHTRLDVASVRRAIAAGAVLERRGAPCP